MPRSLRAGGPKSPTVATRGSRACDPRPVFDHVTLSVSDRSASEAFYDTVLSELGIAKRLEQ